MRNPRQYLRPKVKRRNGFAEFAKAAPGILLGLTVMTVTGVYAASDAIGLISATTRGCDIKGNISINTGERIYHVPGQEYYSETRVSARHGERWFCTEEEARAAGWRKARS